MEASLGTSRDPSNTASSANLIGRVIVLSPSPETTPDALMDAITQRGLEPVIVHHEPAVLVELAQAQAKSVQTKSVLVCHPDKQPLLEDLTQTLDDYFPNVGQWAFDINPKTLIPRLSLLRPSASSEPAEKSPSDSTNSANDQAQTSEAPQLRLAGTEAQPEIAQSNDSSANAYQSVGSFERKLRARHSRQRMEHLVVNVREDQHLPPPLITPEELDMLLGPIEDDLQDD